MVRLSLVNMYLHGFADPHIREYDTLTSEERWNERADVILANPPFMSPKGGIRPHNRFSVKSRRSEVLFVDYMAEHLTPAGRAGIIVPEGVIFQSQKAHTQLRQKLVEEFLVAVVSLPAGVFKPYSGVKTSILVLDRSLARTTDRIAFFKVESDGFDLGDQRRPIDSNDLPQVRSELSEYLRRLRAGELLDGFDPALGLIVEKEKIAADGDYNLSGERYRAVIAVRSEHPMVTIGQVCSVERGASPRPIRDFITKSCDGVNWIKIGDAEVGSKYITATKERITPEGASRSRRVSPGDFILSNSMSFGRPYIMAIEGYIHDGWLLIRHQSEKLDQDFLYHILGSQHVSAQFEQAATGGVVRNLNSKLVRSVKIPLPPLDVQREIVAEIEGYQKVIDGARVVIENYRPHIPINPDWPMVAISRIAAQRKYSLKAGPFGSALKKESYVPDGYKIYGQEQVINGDATYGDYYISEEKYFELESCKVQAGDVLISLVGTYGKTLIVPHDYEPGIINPRLMKITLDELKMMPQFFIAVFAQESVASQIRAMSHGGTMNILSLRILKALQIPVPPLETQQAIVAELEAEQAIVNANRELIERFEQKIHAAIGRVWGESVQYSEST